MRFDRRFGRHHALRTPYLLPPLSPPPDSVRQMPAISETDPSQIVYLSNICQKSDLFNEKSDKLRVVVVRRTCRDIQPLPVSKIIPFNDNIKAPSVPSQKLSALYASAVNTLGVKLQALRLVPVCTSAKAAYNNRGM
jgi:hypothetical protein